MSSEAYSWRAMAAADIPAVSALAAVIHAAFPEDDSVFAERLRLAPAGCRVLSNGPTVLGYVISHPWISSAPPKLNTLLGSLPDHPACWYVHDLAFADEARGSGHGATVMRALRRTGVDAGLPRLELVAVSGSAPFWARQGFAEAAVPSALLASYGPDARYMCSA